MIISNTCASSGLQIDNKPVFDVKGENNTLTCSGKNNSVEYEDTLCALDTAFDETLKPAAVTGAVSNSKNTPDINDTSSFTDCKMPAASYVNHDELMESFQKRKYSVLRKNGEIENTQQNKSGDCWLLSGINALSYTEEGKDIIKNALDYRTDETIVSLPGVQMKVSVSDVELRAAKECEYYSTGDDDMIIFELAMAKARDKIASGEVAINSIYARTVHDGTFIQSSEHGSLSINNGKSTECIYFLTGKLGNVVKDKEEINSALNTFQYNYNRDFVMTAALNSNNEVTDIWGENIELAGPHAYAVKLVGDTTVAITNPWNSEENIILPKETFVDTFDSITYCDLSDANESKNIASHNYEEGDFPGSKHCSFDCADLGIGYYGVEYTNIEQNFYGDKFVSIMHKDNEGTIGKISIRHRNRTEEVYFDKNETLRARYEYIDNKIIKEEYFNEEGNLEKSYITED